MKKFCILMIVLLLWSAGWADNAGADAPYQIALIAPAQIVHKRESIHGVRCNIVYGINDDMIGLDVGMVNQVNGLQKGLQFGLFNTSFKTHGVQIGFFNKTEYLNGIQIGFLNIHAEGNLRILPGVNFSF